jgi:hypothetical protein
LQQVLSTQWALTQKLLPLQAPPSGRLAMQLPLRQKAPPEQSASTVQLDLHMFVPQL